MAASTLSGSGVQRAQRHFILDEICIVVESSTPLSYQDGIALYHEVSQVLDRLVGPGMVLPLERHRGRSISFLHNGENGSVAHLYFRYNSPLEYSDEDRDQKMREVVLNLNHILVLKEQDTGMRSEWKIRGVMPHWIGAACQEGNSDGPAAPPIPVPPRDGNKPQYWQFKFFDGEHGHATLQQYVKDERDRAEKGDFTSDVVVAIIDTSPAEDAVSAAASKFGPTNRLLQKIAPLAAPQSAASSVNSQGSASAPTSPPETVKFDGPIASTAVSHTHLNTVLPNWLERLDEVYEALDGNLQAKLTEFANLKTPNKFGMPDHGLFTTGIIKDIAPTAEIHLVRALSDTGMTDLLGLTDTITQFVSDWEKDNADKRLIICLSVTFGVPTYQRFLNEWLVNPPPGLSPEETAKLHDFAHWGLSNLMTWLASKDNVLVVAAVGNSDPPEKAPDAPRFPAGYSNVLGVAALNRDGHKTAYTNRGNEEKPTDGPSDRGIATRGGDIVREHGKAPVIKEIGPNANDYDAIRGVFSAGSLPHGGGNNQTGWVYWVGTSFAAPIIAGIAAVLWRLNPGNSAKTMIDEVHKYVDQTWSSNSRTELYCDAIFATQEQIEP